MRHRNKAGKVVQSWGRFSTCRWTITVRLKNIRDREGISLSVLSERTGITRANLSCFENSSDDFRVSTLKRYVDGLGVPVSFSFGDNVVVVSVKTKKGKQPASAASAKRKK